MNIFDITKINLKFLFSVVLLASILFLLPNYLDRQAKHKAESFCSSIQVDESVHSLLNKCVAAQANCATWNPENEVTRYQAWFSGFLLNGYTCDIQTKNDKVISKFYEEFTD